jgi:hypothetical protein
MPKLRAMRSLSRDMWVPISNNRARMRWIDLSASGRSRSQSSSTLLALLAEIRDDEDMNDGS